MLKFFVIKMRKVVDNVYIVKPFDPNVQGSCVYMIDTKSDDGLVLIDAGMDIELLRVIEEDWFYLKEIKHCLIINLIYILTHLYKPYIRKGIRELQKCYLLIIILDRWL